MGVVPGMINKRFVKIQSLEGDAIYVLPSNHIDSQSMIECIVIDRLDDVLLVTFEEDYGEGLLVDSVLVRLKEGEL